MKTHHQNIFSKFIESQLFVETFFINNKPIFLSISADIGSYQRNLIVKRQIPNKARRELFRADRAFLNEISSYTKVMPGFYRFADSIGLSIPFVDCLFAGNDDDGELIVLDDLKPYGFRMANRLKGLDYSHCKIALQVSEYFSNKFSFVFGFCFSII